MHAKISAGLGEPMPGIEISTLGDEGLLQKRGW
jgi:pyridoxal biosynthesis lyase PdxS